MDMRYRGRLLTRYRAIFCDEELSHLMLHNFICTVRRCFGMIWRASYLLVDLLPPFLKTFALERLPSRRGRHLSDERAAKRLEIQQLEKLTRDLSVLQVIVVVVLLR